MADGLSSSPRPDASVIEALRGLDTSSVSDAMDRLGISGQCFGLRPLSRGTRLAGPAFTVRYVPVGGDPGSVGDYIDDLEPGTVVVLDNAGRLDATVWGDLLTVTAARRDLAGTVIDGVCRDSDCAIELGYPVFSRSSWMRTGKDRVRVDGYQMPVAIGGARVEPGDLLLGDDDGVLAIPGDRAAQVIEVALGIRDAEATIRADVMAGTPLAVARAKSGYHRLQTRIRP